jgi:1-acyl-sn-glycerol-3-phosphate acyltransferase
MIGTGLLLDAPEPRLIRSMVDKWASTLPWFSIFMQRVGQVVGRPENVDLLLENDELILVFPEGVQGIQKTFQKAYQLDEFGLGFMRLAMAHDCPVVPVAVVGAEEQYPAVWDAKSVGKLLGLKSAPVPLQMLLPFIGLMPLPSKYRITIGKPMHFEGDPDDEDQVIGEKVWVVRHTIQLMLERALKEREHVFW